VWSHLSWESWFGQHLSCCFVRHVVVVWPFYSHDQLLSWALSFFCSHTSTGSSLVCILSTLHWLLYTSCQSNDLTGGKPLFPVKKDYQTTMDVNCFLIVNPLWGVHMPAGVLLIFRRVSLRLSWSAEILQSKDLRKRYVKMTFPKGGVIPGIMWTDPSAEVHFSAV